jgi:hypothetical protein
LASGRVEQLGGGLDRGSQSGQSQQQQRRQVGGPAEEVGEGVQQEIERTFSGGAKRGQAERRSLRSGSEFHFAK